MKIPLTRWTFNWRKALSSLSGDWELFLAILIWYLIYSQWD